MIAKDYVQHQLESAVLPALATFVKNNHHKVKQQVIKGEFFTQMRRHLPEIAGTKAQYGITLENVDIVGVNRDGDIVSLGFSCKAHNRYSRVKETVELLNSLLDSASFDYSKSILGHNLDRITDSLRYAQS